MKLRGKVALVTGGGQGIGLGISQRFAAEGAAVAIAQRKLETAQKAADEIVAAGGQALALKVDVSQPEDVQRMVQETVSRFGGLDILVNNAALTGYTEITFWDFLEMPLEHWRRTIEVNLTGAFLCSQAAARQMARRGGGRIISISSVDAALPELHCSHYAASKGGLESLTRAMALDLAKYGILVNAIAPGPILAHFKHNREQELARPVTLVGRLGLPEDIAGATLLLASDDGSFITGQVLVVDGGFMQKQVRYDEPTGRRAEG